MGVEEEEIEGEVGGERPGHLRALAVERDGRRALKRAARGGEGRCPYCGRYPEPGFAGCARCRELQRVRNAARSERRRAARVAAERAKGPRRCEHCDGADLAKCGSRQGRPYFRCRGCGRRSLGDGVPPSPPSYPCPYCKGQCRIEKRNQGVARNRTVYHCPSCGRYNTNLWPGEAASPGGPFPHYKRFGLNYAANIGLMAYCQVKGMSEVQAIRDIFTRAATKPLGYVSGGSRAGSSGSSGSSVRYRYERYGREDDGWDDEEVGYTVAIPAPAPPVIPLGGVRLPSVVAESMRRFASQKGAAWHCPTVAVVRSVTVALNDAALSGLLATMTARGLNHQEAARALLAEAFVSPA